MRAVAVGLVLFALAAQGATAAVKPKPWAWTTAVAAAQLERANPSPWRDLGTLDVSRCAGKGKQIQRRYLAFACSITFNSRTGEPFKDTLFVKVRAVGKGQVCVSTQSVAAVPNGCLNPKGARTDSDRVHAAAVLQGKVGATTPAYCLGYGAGYFECRFGPDVDSPTAGKATVVMASSPVVTVLTQPS